MREIIREADQNTRMMLLEYLKQLHPIEWKNLVKDTMIFAEESAMFSGVNPFAHDEKGQSRADDLPFYFIGFKSAAPKFTLCTRIWASLLLKSNQAALLVENPEVVQLFGGNTGDEITVLLQFHDKEGQYLVSRHLLSIYCIHNIL